MKRYLLFLVFASATLPIMAQNQSSKTLGVIAFGSCSHETDTAQLWNDIIALKPNLWIWMGDNIYGDTHDMALMKQKYDIQKQNPEYQRLVKTCPVIGTWDDHDYGINDGGKNFSKRRRVKHSHSIFSMFRRMQKSGNARVSTTAMTMARKERK